ncbi:hypothetical protein [Falsiroseomonas sp. CW058]|uniref:hypothetical protein n=1 Tax=Falsiroseomonas sp. CW058 TaxID=3388664 RepID=UPI003D31A89F
MGMGLAEVMQEEREALMAEAVAAERAGAAILPYAAVAELADALHTPGALRRAHPVAFAALAGARGGALVQSCPTLGYRMLWVHADNDHYRDDYELYLRTCRGHAGGALPDSHHVDHLFNRARAQRLRLSWIRAVLLPRGINTSHGAGYEKARTRGLVGTPERPRTIDEVTLMKLWLVRSPRKGQPLTPEMRAHAGRMAALFGLSPAEIEANIRDLMAVAAFRPGG